MIDRACISLNTRCNLRCNYCHFGNKVNPIGSTANDFSLPEIKMVINHLIDYVFAENIPVFKLGIVGAGEPLLSFEVIKEIVLLVEQKAFSRIHLYTISNGTIFTQDMVKFFFDHRDTIELNISLDGDEKLNRELRHSFPDFSLYEKIFKQKPKINAVVTKPLIERKEEILDFYLLHGFPRVNFSKAFGIKDPTLTITDEEYQSFLLDAKRKNIQFRQDSSEEKYDCAKYGNLCGVGVTNIFIAKNGIYPCSRFFNNPKYRLGEITDPIQKIQIALEQYPPCPKKQCFFEFNNCEVEQ